MPHRIAYWLALALLTFTGVVGIYNGFTEWGDPMDAFQKSVLFGVIAYGILGLLAVYAVLRLKPWSKYAVIGWAIAVTYVPGAAVMAYAEGGDTLGPALAASVGSAIIAALVLWAIRPRHSASKLPDSF